MRIIAPLAAAWLMLAAAQINPFRGVRVPVDREQRFRGIVNTGSS
jgi:hypothetical protein